MSNDMNENQNNPYSSLFETYRIQKEEPKTDQYQAAYQTSYSAVPEEPVKKPHKRLKKFVSLVLSGILVGAIAGGTMVGIQVGAEKSGLLAKEETTAAAPKIQVAEKAVTSGTGTSAGALADVSGVVDQVLPSVVAITNSQIYDSYADRFGGSQFDDFFNYYFGGGFGSRGNSNGNQEGEEVEAGRGSGIIVGQNDKELLIVTNYHVVEDADSLTITFADNKTAKASLKGTDSENDLAVVAVKKADLEEGTSDAIAIATLHNSDDCKVGQGVIAIGNALGYGQSITVGYISALDREVSTGDGSTKNLLQTDAAINPGNSGGALVNSQGEIIGINSAKYSDTDVEGMGFAIPIAKVYDIIGDLMTQETKTEVPEAERGYLNINAATVDSERSQLYNIPEGVYVHSIIEGGGASKSDLQTYDVITKINGTTVRTQEDLIDQLKYYRVDDTVKLNVFRLEENEYKEHTVEVTLGKKASE